ncbi:MAG: YceI family protein [Bdellovibrionales bacterium]
MRFMPITIFILAAVSGSSAFGLGGKIHLAKDKGELKALAIGRPRALKINVEGSGPAGVLTIENGKLRGEIEVDMRSLETGIALRDRHLKETYIQTKEFPHAKLQLKGLSLSAKDLKSGFKNRDFAGDLHFHGVKKPITGQLDLEPGLKMQARFKIRLTDFDVKVPSYLGVTVAETLDVEVKSTARLEEK